MTDDNEIIKFACEKCKNNEKGTYRELFGDLPSLVLLPKLVCKCGGDITIEMTGTYEKMP